MRKNEKPLNPVLQSDPFKPKTVKEKKEDTLFFKDCVVCNGHIGYGYYGRWGDSGTCSKTCEKAQQEKVEANPIQP